MMITKMTMMKTDSKFSMMTMKQIINNYDDNNQHDHGEDDAGDTNEDMAMISKMMTTMTITEKTSMMTANQILKF